MLTWQTVDGPEEGSQTITLTIQVAVRFRSCRSGLSCCVQPLQRFPCRPGPFLCRGRLSARAPHFPHPLPATALACLICTARRCALALCIIAV